MADPADFLYSAADPIYRWRYGMGSAEKSGLAVNREIPGARSVITPEDAEREERRASGYLFARKHPTIGVPIVTAVNAFRSLWEPPEMYNVAVDAARAGAAGIPLASDQARGLQPGYTPERRGWTGGW